MRKTLVISAILIGFVSASAGLANYSGPTDRPHIMGAPSPDIFTVEVVNVTPSAGAEDSVTVENLEEVNGTWSVSLTGEMQTPTPCYTVRHTTTKTNSTYTLDVKSVSTNETCVQSLAKLEYSAEAQLEDDFTLVVKHNGEEVKTVTPADTTRPDNQGFLAGLLRWLSNLF